MVVIYAIVILKKKKEKKQSAKYHAFTQGSEKGLLFRYKYQWLISRLEPLTYKYVTQTQFYRCSTATFTQAIVIFTLVSVLPFVFRLLQRDKVIHMSESAFSGSFYFTKTKGCFDWCCAVSME